MHDDLIVGDTPKARARRRRLVGHQIDADGGEAYLVLKVLQAALDLLNLAPLLGQGVVDLEDVGWAGVGPLAHLGQQGTKRRGRAGDGGGAECGDAELRQGRGDTRHGLAAYEVSNYAAPGAESRHNLTYWRYGDYVGIGPGAHGRLTRGASKLATATERHPENWLETVEREGHGMVDQELLDDHLNIVQHYLNK